VTLSPNSSSYAETWRGKGIPLNQLAPFVERAIMAGAPRNARLHLENAPADIMSGLPLGGTRAYITWPYQEPDAGPNEGADPDPEDRTE
jgi:hypothetical protein